MIKIKIKSKNIDASPDGVTVVTYESKQKYLVPDDLAKLLCGNMQVANYVKKKQQESDNPPDPNKDETNDENNGEDTSESRDTSGESGGGENPAPGDSD